MCGAAYRIKKTDQPKKEGQSETDFRHLHEQFPELVDRNGNGWFYTFVQNTIKIIKDNPEKVSKYDQKKPEQLKGFTAAWRKKVMQYQVPLYSSKTQGSFLIHFDDILADALEQGELQNKDFELSPELTEQLISATPKGAKPEVLITLYKYYIANKQDNTDWVILPVTNFDACFGTTAFGRRYLSLKKQIFLKQKRVMEFVDTKILLKFNLNVKSYIYYFHIWLCNTL